LSTVLDSSNQQSRLEKYFLRNSFILVVVELGTKLLGLALFIFIARKLGATLTGIYSYGLAFTTLFSIIPSFGFDRLVQRDVGRNSAMARGLFIELSLLKLVLSLISFLLIYVVLRMTGDENIDILMVIAVFVLLLNYTLFVNTFFRALGHPEIELLTRLVFSVLSAGLGITALSLNYGLLSVLYAQIIATLIAGILSVIFIFVKTEADGKISVWTNSVKHIIRSAPFALNHVILYFGNQINYVILGLMANETSVGYFSTAYRVFDTITLIPAAIMGAFLPLMSKLHNESDTRFHSVLRFTLRTLFIISLGVMIGTWVIGDSLILTLFGDEFAISGFLLKLMNTSLIFSFWNFILTNLLIAIDKEKLLIPIFAAGAAIHIVGNIILITFMGVEGAAVAILVTQAIQFLILSWYNRDQLLLADYFSRLPSILLSALIMATLALLFVNYNIWLSIGLAVAGYFLSLVIMGGIQRNDTLILKHIVEKEDVL
jgi:O-antigen/teichoic acid export membrane protein